MLRVRHRGPSPEQRRTRILVIAGAAVVVVALVATLFVVFAPRDTDPVAEPSDSPSLPSSPPPTPTPTPTPTFARDQFSIDDPTSLWVVVNKQRPLNPLDYAPADLVGLTLPEGGQMRAEAAAQVEALAAQFTAETGQQFRTVSSYRSYSRQVDVYNGWVSRLGQEAADLTSARPGHSEHQTGFVIDFGAVPAQCDLDQCFADTTQGSWLAANAYKWGFILRYPNGYTDITGYEFEPWHYRYVGVELATEMHDTGVMTLEEFFGLPAAPTY
jgi:zinc D-Ala-D-Ala carboxypeptidase